MEYRIKIEYAHETKVVVAWSDDGLVKIVKEMLAVGTWHEVIISSMDLKTIYWWVTNDAPKRSLGVTAIHSAGFAYRRTFENEDEAKSYVKMLNASKYRAAIL